MEKRHDNTGRLPSVEVVVNHNDSFKMLMQLVDKTKQIQVRTNADTPKDAAQPLKFGAEGIGLFRTEHMFMARVAINLCSYCEK
ncbi:MAG: putative PEP-binding protein [Chitinophagaceae bacterium]